MIVAECRGVMVIVLSAYSGVPLQDFVLEPSILAGF
jgi:hypothetical protein